MMSAASNSSLKQSCSALTSVTAAAAADDDADADADVQCIVYMLQVVWTLMHQ